MIISVNWLKKFTDITLPIHELAERIGSRLVEIEEVIDIGSRYDGIIVAEITAVEPHPNADKLNVYQIDDGGAVDGVDRLDNGRVQIVSGDRGLQVGDKVAWLTPGSTVPASFADAEPFVLGSREMRGEISHGMLGSGKELAVNTDGSAVLVLDTDAPAGSLFRDVFELDDYLLDIANKSLTHRPDTFGLIGFAREVAAIQGLDFVSPEWYMVTDPVLTRPEEMWATPAITIEDNDLCQRYEAVVLTDVDTSRQSPLIIQSYLRRSGVRPVNAVVDVTNYLMLVTGHPLHAFDYDALVRVQGSGETPRITVRRARDGEDLTLLDGRTISLSPGDILICAGDVPVGLAGAMGGAETEVTDKTRSILLESATFNLFNLRTTAMRHGITSEAVTRFTKGQAARQTAPVLASAVRMLSSAAGGRRVSAIADVWSQSTVQTALAVPVSRVNAILGTALSPESAAAPLRAVEFSVDVTEDGVLQVTPPFWRSDIHIAEDVIEEVGRIVGYDTIAPVLPRRDVRAVMPDSFDMYRENVRQRLSARGANEVLTYSFVHGDTMRKANQDPAAGYRIVNALSPELQHYRVSLLPSLLEKVYGNVRQNEPLFGLYEINKVHVRGEMDNDEPDVPREFMRLAYVVAAADKTAQTVFGGSPYYQAKAVLEAILPAADTAIDFVARGDSDETLAADNRVMRLMAAPFEPRRSALVRVNGQLIGVVGEIRRRTSADFKLPAFCAGFELDLKALGVVAATQGSTYRPISRFQGTSQDICLEIDADTPYAAVAACFTTVLGGTAYVWDLQPVDIFQAEGSADKRITIRVTLQDYQATIGAEAAHEVTRRIVSAAQTELSAKHI